MIAPLQMESFHVVDFQFSTNSEYDVKNEEIAIQLYIGGKEVEKYSFSSDELCNEILFNINIGSGFMMMDHKGSDNENFRVSLNVSMNEFGVEDDNKFPYRLNTTVFGDFSVAKIPEDGYDQILKIIRVNATSMLYGMIRKLIIDMTNISPFKPFIVPSLQFKEIIEYEQEISKEN